MYYLETRNPGYSKGNTKIIDLKRGNSECVYSFNSVKELILYPHTYTFLDG